MAIKPISLLAGLPPEKLRWRCDPATIPFETTAEAEPVTDLVGQERAFRALKMGVELSAPGYNIFVCGLAGTSRGGTITHVIEQIHPAAKSSLDRCYVNNFKSPDRPRLLTLPRGQANNFKKDMQSGIEFLRRRIPQVFEGEPFQRQKGRIVDRFTVREKELMDDFTRRIAREQFALGHMQVGAVALPEIFPVLEGQMVPIEDIPKLVHEGKLETVAAEDLERKYEQFRQEFTVVYRKTLTLSRELASELSLSRTGSGLGAGRRLHRGTEGKIFRRAGVRISGRSAPQYPRQPRSVQGARRGRRAWRRPPSEGGSRSATAERDPFRVYGVNVLLAHNDEDGSPVIFETTPTYTNLFGTIQRSYDSRGGWNSDFMDLRAGSTPARRWRVPGDVRV